MSPLFTTAELGRPAPPAAAADPMRPGVLRTPALPALYLLSKGRQALRQHVGQLVPGQLTHYATGGRWSAHELLQFILEHTGPARVSISTWTITEAPVRALLALREAGLLPELTLLFDHRIKTRCPKAVQLVAALGARVGLAKCHAKVTIVENDAWAVTVLSSQNYTRNPRIEAGVICTDRASATFHAGWLHAQLAGQQPFV